MKASDWISVKDRLPKIGRRVIVYQSFNDDSNFVRMATRVKINQCDRWYDDDGFEVEYISHWQPIVFPKKEEL
jgi:hypothetical protein